MKSKSDSENRSTKCIGIYRVTVPPKTIFCKIACTYLVHQNTQNTESYTLSRCTLEMHFCAPYRNMVTCSVRPLIRNQLYHTPQISSVFPFKTEFIPFSIYSDSGTNLQNATAPVQSPATITFLNSSYSASTAAEGKLPSKVLSPVMLEYSAYRSQCNSLV